MQERTRAPPPNPFDPIPSASVPSSRRLEAPRLRDIDHEAAGDCHPLRADVRCHRTAKGVHLDQCGTTLRILVVGPTPVVSAVWTPDAALRPWWASPRDSRVSIPDRWAFSAWAATGDSLRHRSPGGRFDRGLHRVVPFEILTLARMEARVWSYSI